jgi:hypothetical protein
MIKKLMMGLCLTFTASRILGAPLFEPVSAGAVSGDPASSSRAVMRSLDVRVDLVILKTVAAATADVLEFNLFPDVTVSGTVTRRTVRNASSFTLSGTVGNPGGGTFILTAEGESVVGQVWLADGRHFEIGFSSEGQQAIREINNALLLPELEPLRVEGLTPDPVPVQGQGYASLPDTADTIYVMVLYTPAARIAAGGTAAMQAIINQSVQDANLAYQNSGITPRLALAAQAEVNYTETDLGVALSALRNPSDGVMDEIHGMRDTNRADMVCLMTSLPSSSAAGVGYLMTTLTTNFADYAFCVVEWNYAVGNHTFAHELGHNMGCHHAVGDSGAVQGAGLFYYSHGWRFTGGDSVQYRTVMSYAPGIRIGYFSNPLINYQGIATGTTNANNAATINNSASTVANFRQGTPGSLVAVPTLTEWGLIALVLMVIGLGARRLAWVRVRD